MINDDTTRKAVVLFSGGLDSTTCLFIAKNQGYEIIPLVIDYSQRHNIEKKYAKKILKILKIDNAIFFNMDFSLIGGSALTADIHVPKGGNHIGKSEIPITYVPGRNLIFLSLAIAVAEVYNMHDIFIGVNALDYSGYPDCRADFIKSFEETALLASKAGREGRPFHIKTPLIDLTKTEIIQQGMSLGVPCEHTWSCYDPQDEKPCRECDACILRTQGFKNIGLNDPLIDKTYS